MQIRWVGSLRGLGQIVLLWGFTVVFLTASLLFAPLVPRRAFESFRCWVIRSWARTGLGILRVRIHLEGSRRLAGRTTRIITFNHSSLLDIFVVLALLPDGGVPVVKREVLRYPFIGWGVRMLGILPLPRSDLARARSMLQRVAERMNRERLSVIIAPEGTRSKSGALQAFKLGAFHLALQSRAPMVPLVIGNANRLLPVGSLCCIPGMVTVRVLEPISSLDYRLEDLRYEAARLMAVYERELTPSSSARLDRDAVYGPGGSNATRNDDI